MARTRLFLILSAAVFAAVAVYVSVTLERWIARPAPATTPSAATTASAATEPVITDKPPTPPDYMGVLLQEHPTLPTTRPLEDRLNLAFAGHFVFREPIYVDHCGVLWLTRADAPATVGSSPEYGAMIVRHRVLYAHWAQSAAGPVPRWISPNLAGDGFELVWPDGRAAAIGEGLDYDWKRAFSWDARVIVPTSRGASVFELPEVFSAAIVEHKSPPLIDVTGEPVQLAFSDGPLAWVPPGDHGPGGRGILRWKDGQWHHLFQADQWPDDLLHIVPLLDGSLIRLRGSNNQPVSLDLVVLDTPAIDQQKVRELIIRLSDPDPAERDRAFEQLGRYGPGMWPIAEQMLELEPPETQERLRQLLQAKVSPLLGGMELASGPLQLKWRFDDGSAIYRSEAGVRLPQVGGGLRRVAPAWLAIVPGQPVRLLSEDLIAELQREDSRLFRTADGSWFVSDEAAGVRRYVSTGIFENLTREDEREFTQVVATASGGRILLRGADDDGRTLVIDPRLPDPRPRFPLWLLACPQGQVGWDNQGWPTAKSRGAWSLRTSDWRAIDEKKDSFSARAEDLPVLNWCRPSTTSASTGPATDVAAHDPPLLVDIDGNAWFGGNSVLRVIHADGSEICWQLPPQAIGEHRPHLVRIDQRLFLFNQAGRLLRIRKTADPEHPFELEATFTSGIPNDPDLTRMWLDPAGRIIMCWSGNRLAVGFPAGYVPSETPNLIPDGEQDAVRRW